MRPGDRVICLDRPLWRGGKLRAYEGVYVGLREDGLHEVDFPFLARNIYLPGECVCPVYRDCEVCGYAAWRAVEDKKAKRWHHYCAWHLTPTEELV